MFNSHILYLVNVVMAPVAVDGLHRRCVPALHHTHEVVPWVADAHHVVVVCEQLIALVVADECPVLQCLCPPLNILAKYLPSPGSTNTGTSCGHCAWYSANLLLNRSGVLLSKSTIHEKSRHVCFATDGRQYRSNSPNRCSSH